MSDPAEMRMFDLGLAKGMEIQRERIIKLLEDRLLMAKDEKYGLMAMRVPVDRTSAIAVTEALLWAIKGTK